MSYCPNDVRYFIEFYSKLDVLNVNDLSILLLNMSMKYGVMHRHKSHVEIIILC